MKQPGAVPTPSRRDCLPVGRVPDEPSAASRTSTTGSRMRSAAFPTGSGMERWKAGTRVPFPG
ncbi:hypothetical protein EQK42_03320 [Streptomyces albidoflavus]|nr:hypothetical protein DI273_07840 [Streptomyces violascens]RWZ77384.1 hypothetical protein EQK42_03320 [Streptomyces albidoflavus]